LPLATQDDHRRLTRDPLRAAENEAIEDQVAKEHDTTAGEAVDQDVIAGAFTHGSILQGTGNGRQGPGNGANETADG
jgi:hypothetical protein